MISTQTSLFVDVWKEGREIFAYFVSAWFLAEILESSEEVEVDQDATLAEFVLINEVSWLK